MSAPNRKKKEKTNNNSNTGAIHPSKPCQGNVKKTKTSGANVADSNILALIKLQSIGTKCQEKLGSSAT